MAESDLFAAMPRCQRPEIQHLRMFDVAEGDDDRTRRWKWNSRCIDIYLTPCSNNPGGPPEACARCRASYESAFNHPEGPWSPQARRGA